MIEYKWSVPMLERKLNDGFVLVAHWRCDASDGDYSASSYGTAGWPEGEPETPYDQLTEEQVLGWVWNDGVDKDATEAALQSKIDAQMNPTTADGVPW